MKWNWYTLGKELDSRRPSLTIKPVIWEKPPSSWIKVNTDGSSSLGNQTSGIGGIVRDGNGDLIMAFSKKLHFCTNNQAEIQAALFAVN